MQHLTYSVQERRYTKLKCHCVKDDKDICVALRVTFLFYTDSGLTGNTEKYCEENYNSKVACTHT